MRFTDEVHYRFNGPYEECTARIPNARAWLAEALTVAGETDTPANYWVKKVLQDGSIYRAWLGEPPILEITVSPPGGGEPPEEDYLLVLPWKPEGFLLTPVSTTYPDGIGLPYRDPIDPLGAKLGTWTPGGIYPQVLLNKYKNNKYLDDLDYMVGLPGQVYGKIPRKSRQLRDAYTDDGNGVPVDDDTSSDGIFWQWATLFGGLASFKDYPGDPNVDLTLESHYEFEDEFDLLNGGVFTLTTNYQEIAGQTLTVRSGTQIADRDSVTEEEFDGLTWFSHQPEEVLYPLAIQEGVYQQTNFFRIDATPAATRFSRPLRGMASPGYWGAREIGTSVANYWGHSHYEFRPGLRTAGGRNAACSGQEPGQNTANNPCENAVTFASLTPGDSLTQGAEIVQFWRDSPGHYAAITSPVWEPDVRLLHYTVSKELAYCDGASLDVGGYGVGINFETYFDVNSPGGDKPYWSEETWTFGDSQGYAIFTEIFQQRETWLPTPEWTTKTYAGSVGLYSNPNVWAGLPNTYIRRFTVGSRSFEVPPGNYPPFLDASSSNDPNFPVYDAATDVFMGVIGVHPFELNGRTYLRVVVAENDVGQIAEAEGGTTNRDYVGTYLELVVYVLPASLVDTGRMSWRDPKYTEWFEEAREQWLPAGGVLAPILPSHADFTSDGSKFCVQVYEYGGDQTTYSKRVGAAFGNTTVPGPWYETIPKARKAVRPRTLIYDSLGTSFTLEASQTPIMNEVLQASLEDVLMGDVTVNMPLGGTQDFETPRNKFERRVLGTYQVFPHYDENDFLKHVTLDVNEYQFDYDLAKRDVAHSPMDDTFAHYGWMIHKLIYPDNEEFIIRQRFWDCPPMSAVDFTTPASWGPGDTVTNTYKTGVVGFRSGFDRHLTAPVGDGTSQSFNTIIHNWDVKTKRMVYSKEVYSDKEWYTTDVEPDPPAFIPPVPAVGEEYYVFRVVQADQYLYHYDGSGDILLPGSIALGTTELWSDLPNQPSQDGVWDFGHYHGHEIYYDPEYLWEDIDLGEKFQFFYTTECYNAQSEGVVGNIYEVDDISNPTEGRRCIFTSIGRMPQDYTTWLFADAHTRTWFNYDPYEVTTFDSNDNQMSIVDRMSWLDYEVSACCHTKYKLESADYGMAQNDLTTHSAQPHNIMPAFSSLPNYSKTNLLHYEDRWVVRGWWRHWSTAHGLTPDYSVEAWGQLPQPSFYLPPDTAVLGEWIVVSANFDLSALTGIPAITDIYPCAVIE